MIPRPEEKNGDDWNAEAQDEAQALSWKLLHQLVATVAVGDSEEDLHRRFKQLCKENNVEKLWHPSKLRCGVNSVKSFREVSQVGVILNEGDLFFVDIGPVFNGYEGDVGAAFVLTRNGASATAHPLCRDAKAIWHHVAHRWKTTHVGGEALYQFAAEQAASLGWILNLEGASGHRIGDFPHNVHWRGTLKKFESHATESRWILEIQIRHPKLPLGAFYEDILK